MMLNSYYSSYYMEKSSQKTIQKPIQDRLRNASCITIESALRNKVDMNISWYDVHGEEQSQKYTISAGSVIEF
jgi:hypothetical protein